MKKRAKNESFYCPISRFVKEDFIELIEIFKTNCKRVEITVGEYELDSVDDIEKIDLKETSEYHLKGHDPYITLESIKFKTRLYLSDTQDIIQQGMKGRIEEIFKKKKSILSFFELSIRNAAIMIVVGFFLGQLSKYDLSISIIFGVMFCAFWFYMFYTSMNKHSIVYLKKSRNDLSYWEKNGDLAIITFVTTLIAGLLVYLFSKLI
ncbi:MAG: hypothetical protein Q8S57_03250 [Methanoregula sp.]|nr:hypothetical protein [Methanoregula sp.]